MANELIPGGGSGLPAAGGNSAEPFVDLSRQGQGLPAGKGGEVAARDERDLSNMVEVLRGELGPDLEATLWLCDEFMSNELGEQLMSDQVHSRMPDGSLVGNNADLVRLVMAIAELDLVLKRLEEDGVMLPNLGGSASTGLISVRASRLSQMRRQAVRASVVQKFA